MAFKNGRGFSVIEGGDVVSKTPINENTEILTKLLDTLENISAVDVAGVNAYQCRIDTILGYTEPLVVYLNKITTNTGNSTLSIVTNKGGTTDTVLPPKKILFNGSEVLPETLKYGMTLQYNSTLDSGNGGFELNENYLNDIVGLEGINGIPTGGIIILGTELVETGKSYTDLRTKHYKQYEITGLVGGNTFDTCEKKEWSLKAIADSEEVLRVEDIVDNLTTASATKPLSANQGKVLSDRSNCMAGGQIKGYIEDGGLHLVGEIWLSKNVTGEFRCLIENSDNTIIGDNWLQIDDNTNATKLENLFTHSEIGLSLQSEVGGTDATLKLFKDGILGTAYLTLANFKSIAGSKIYEGIVPLEFRPKYKVTIPMEDSAVQYGTLQIRTDGNISYMTQTQKTFGTNFVDTSATYKIV